MQLDGASNTLAMPDHADHIHVGWHALAGEAHQRQNMASARAATALSSKQWMKLIDRLGGIANPKVHGDVPDHARPRADR
jgi:hypothetical protein